MSKDTGAWLLLALLLVGLLFFFVYNLPALALPALADLQFSVA